MTVAYWCIFIMIFVPIALSVFGKLKGKTYNLTTNHYPRDYFAKATGIVARANAAQLNSFEIFPAFAAAVIIAHLTGNASQFIIDRWAVIFVLSRIAYCICYIMDWAMLRSLIFGVNLFCITALFIAAT